MTKPPYLIFPPGSRIPASSFGPLQKLKSIIVQNAPGSLSYRIHITRALPTGPCSFLLPETIEPGQYLVSFVAATHPPLPITLIVVPKEEIKATEYFLLAMDYWGEADEFESDNNPLKASEKFLQAGLTYLRAGEIALSSRAWNRSIQAQVAFTQQDNLPEPTFSYLLIYRRQIIPQLPSLNEGHALLQLADSILSAYCLGLCELGRQFLDIAQSELRNDQSRDIWIFVDSLTAMARLTDPAVSPSETDDRFDNKEAWNTSLEELIYATG